MEEFGEIADAKRDVKTLIDQVHRPVEQQEPRRHGRVSIKKGVENRPQHHLARYDRGRQRERAARRGPFAAGQDVGLLEFGEDVPAGRRIALADLAQLDRSRRAMQQLGPDMGFEKGDGAADRGGRAAELAARCGKTPLVERRDEDLHRIDTVHHSSPAAMAGGRPVMPAIIPHSSTNRKSVCRTTGIRSRPERA